MSGCHMNIIITSDFTLESEYDFYHIFATIEQEESEIYPPIIKEIIEDQCRSCLVKLFLG